MKLSKAQLDMLKAVRNAPKALREKYVAYSSYNSYENRVSDIGFYAPFSGSTYKALSAKGLVAVEMGEHWYFILTEAGRQALLEAEGAGAE